MIWAASGLALVACSDKGSNNGGIQCPAGMVQMNGFCSYDGSNGGSGGLYPGGNYGFNPNGSLHNTDYFRDFKYRLYNYKYFCYGSSYGYSCGDAQVRIQKINETEYNIYLTSPSLGTGGGATVVLKGTKFQYTGQSEVIFEVYYGNPTQYIIAELVMTSGLDSSSTTYSFYYKNNAHSNTGTPIITGVMRKNIDY
jgi:hypothetical protein